MEVWAVEESLCWSCPEEISDFQSYFAVVLQFEFECRARGADILAYPPVVAGGNRSNTLHYVKNNQRIKVHRPPSVLLPLGPDALVNSNLMVP